MFGMTLPPFFEAFELITAKLLWFMRWMRGEGYWEKNVERWGMKKGERDEKGDERRGERDNKGTEGEG